jgi:DNA-binding NarL/FixJ family response regulator
VIVDDNDVFLASASRLLESQGAEVVGCASSADEAVELTVAAEPDVALVDVQLGEEDGFDLAKRLAAFAPATAVILISTHSADELAELIAASSAVGFLAKSQLGVAAMAELLTSGPRGT